MEYRLRRFPQNYQGSAISDNNVGFKLNPALKYTCSLENLLTHEITGCRIIAQFIDNSITYKESIVFRVQLNPTIPLLLLNQHIMEITTINGNGLPEGIEWPQVAGKYLIEVSVDRDPTVGNTPPTLGVVERRNNWIV